MTTASRHGGDGEGALPPPEVCDRARVARDRRFDGRFFTGVRTTGIYCRPVCPVVPARSRNVRFFPNAVAAERAGFRPCLRCRPEAAPGSPAWRGSGATVSRALSLIGRGWLDEHSLPDLAGVLGVGPRHLTRLFLKHCGAPPGVVARSRRVQLAKRLLDETELPMIEVAFAAGFSSVRRFNAALRETYGRPPSHLRRRRPLAEPSGALALRLDYRPPYDWPLMLRLLAMEAVPGVESVSATEYARTVGAGDGVGWLAVRAMPGEAAALSLSLQLPEHEGLGAVIERVQTMLDLSADPEQIGSATAGCSPPGGTRVRPSAVRLPGAWDGFEVAVRAAIAADLGAARAGPAMTALVRDLGAAVRFAARPELAYVFPGPERLAAAPLRRYGLSSRGAARLRRLALAAASGRIRFDGSMAFGELAAALVEEGALAPADASWVGMRTLTEPDVDLTDRLPLDRRHRAWWRAQVERGAVQPWRSYAALLLWLSTGGAMRAAATSGSPSSGRAAGTS